MPAKAGSKPIKATRSDGGARPSEDVTDWRVDLFLESVKQEPVAKRGRSKNGGVRSDSTR